MRLCSGVHDDGRVGVSARGMLRSLLNYDSEPERRVRACVSEKLLQTCATPLVNMCECLCAWMSMRRQ